MKPTVLGLLVAAAAFGASTIYLSAQLSDERANSKQLADETRALHARIAELERARAERRFAAAGPFSTVMAPAGAPMEPPPPRVVNFDASTETIEGVLINAPPRNEVFINKMLRSQVRSHNKQAYADLGAQLGLSKDEANKLIDLLTDQQLEGFKSTRDSLSPEETWRLIDEKQRENKAEIAELIGSDKAETLEEYQQSLPVRQEMEMLSLQLDGSDSSLSEQQHKRMLSAMVEERKRIAMPKMSDTNSPEEFSKAYAAWQDDYSERVASHARSILNSEQLNTYNEYQQWQKEMRDQMATMRLGSVQGYSGGANLMFTTAAPVIGAEVAVAADEPTKTP